MNLIAVVGLIGSGKSTVGRHISLKHGYQQTSFANTLKDSVSSLFGWPRFLLEGDTDESRIFREIVDEYWSQKLGRTITPRIVLQEMGTEVVREGFHADFWIHSLEKKLLRHSNYVITDARFHNEIDWLPKAASPFMFKEVKILNGLNLQRHLLT
jgi:dephospho-CoA kinase